MPEVQFVSFILISVGLLLALARGIGLPHSIVLFAGGLLSVLVPGPIPLLSVDPMVVLGLLLTPLLYAGVVGQSPVGLRQVLVRGILGGAVLTIGLALAGMTAAAWLLPGLPAVAALLLGLTLSVGDGQLAQETGADRTLPRALTDGQQARIVTGPVVTVSLVALATAHLSGPLPGAMDFALRLVRDVVGGGVAGLVIGLVLAEVRRRIGPATVEVALSLATPFIGAMLAEAVGLSVVAVVIATALTVAWRSVDRRTGEAISSPEARLILRHFWDQVGGIVSAALFFLMGRALPEAFSATSALPWLDLLRAAIVLVGIALLVQFVVELGLRRLPRAPACPDAQGRPVGTMRAAVPAAFAGGRSVVALAIALSIPVAAPDGTPFAAREAVVAVTAMVVIGGTLLQWLLLPRVVAWAGLGGVEEASLEAELAAGVARREAAAEPAEDPAAGAAAARRALADLQARGAVGEQARRDAEEAADAQARAQRTTADGG